MTGSRLPIYRSSLPDLAWPPVANGKAASLAALIALLDTTQWLPREELERRALAQLGTLAAHAERESPFFAERLKAAGLTAADLGRWEGLRALPPLRRRQIQEAGDRMYCAAVPEAHQPTRDGHTSGSTGEPLKIRRTAITDLIWMANGIRDHLWHRRDLRGRLASIRGMTEVVQLNSWGSPVNLLYATGPGLGLPQRLPIGEQVARLRAFGPSSLMTYPSVLGPLMDELVTSGGPILTLRHIRTLSEMVTPELRARSKAVFGLGIEDTYSAADVGVIALQCPDCGAYHVMAETLILEVLDEAGRPCAPGEVGRVILTDPTNYAMPLIRYDIGDYAEVGGPAECGRGLPVLRRIVGRERNLALMPDGRRQWPRVGFPYFRSVAPVLQFQFVQTSRTAIEANLVVERPLSTAEEDALRDIVAEALGHRFEMSFSYFAGALPRGPNGKFEEFINRVGV